MKEEILAGLVTCVLGLVAIAALSITVGYCLTLGYRLAGGA